MDEASTANYDARTGRLAVLRRENFNQLVEVNLCSKFDVQSMERRFDLASGHESVPLAIYRVEKTPWRIDRLAVKGTPSFNHRKQLQHGCLDRAGHVF